MAPVEGGGSQDVLGLFEGCPVPGLYSAITVILQSILLRSLGQV